MANDEHKKHKPERQDFAFGISLGEWVTATFFGIGSGLVTAAKTIRDHFHKDVVHSTEFAEHFGTGEKGRQARLDAIKAANYENKWDYWKAISEKKRELASEYDDLALLHRHVRKNSILGTIDRFPGLSPRSKSSIYFSTAFGIAIGSAMALSFFNGVATRDRIERIEDAVTKEQSR